MSKSDISLVSIFLTEKKNCKHLMNFKAKNVTPLLNLMNVYSINMYYYVTIYMLFMWQNQIAYFFICLIIYLMIHLLIVLSYFLK